MPRAPIRFTSQEIGDLLLRCYQANKSAPAPTRQELLDGLLASVMTAAPVTPYEFERDQSAVTQAISR